MLFEGTNMADLTTIAQRLRTARRFQSEFLARWAAENLMSRPIFLDGVLAAVERKALRAALPGGDQSVAAFERARGKRKMRGGG
jgi:hypothetical protein